MSSNPTDHTFGPFIGSILPYLSQASQQGSLFDFPMPGITQNASILASGHMGAPGGMEQLGLLHDAIAASGIATAMAPPEADASEAKSG